MMSRVESISPTKESEQGRIVTENPALLALLKENTMDKPVRRVYVDSPVLAHDDEEKYRFISTDVEGFDEIQDHALQDSDTARGEMNPVSVLKERAPASHPSLAERNTNAARYEDYNTKTGNFTGNENHGSETEFVLRSRESDRRKRTSRGSFGGMGPPPVQPIRSPLKPLNKDEELDLSDLEQERNYQQQLQTRIKEQAQVPSLQLPQDPDVGDVNPTDSLEVAKPSDSLDEESDKNSESSPQPVAHMGSLQWETHSRNKNRTPSTEYPSLIAQLQQENAALQRQWQQGQPQDFSKLQLEAKLQQEKLEKEKLQIQIQQKDLEQMRLQQDMQRQQQQLLMQQQQQLQTMMMVNQPAMMLAAGQMAQQQQQAQQLGLVQPQLGTMAPQQGLMQPQQGLMQQQPGHMQQQQGMVQPLMQLQQPAQQPGETQTGPAELPALSPEAYEEGQYRLESGQDTSQEDYYAQYQADTGHYYQDDTLDTPSEAGDSAIIRPVVQHRSPRPEVDFLEANKQALHKGRPQKSYAQILSKKKDLKNSNPVPAPAPRAQKKASNKKPPLPNREVVPVSMPTSATGLGVEPALSPTKPASAEQLWQMRSQSLAQQKEVRVAGKDAKKGKSLVAAQGHRPDRPLQKFPSESRMHDFHQENSAYHQPPVPQRSMAEPVRAQAEGPVAVSPRNNQPIRHMVLTEDGQQVSVDINLKVLSPTPGQGGVGRQGARIQEASRPALPQYQGQGYQESLPSPRNAGPPQQPMQAFIQSPTQQYSTHVFGGPQRPIQQYQDEGGYVGTGVAYGGQDPVMAADPRLGSPGSLPSPYKVLPPIGSADTDQGRMPYSEYQPPADHRRPSGEEQGSYMEQFQRQRNPKANYKAYTLKDYKSLKREVRLGGLGPDVDTETHREKRDKVFRQQEYARRINERNRVQAMKPMRPRPAEPQALEPEDDMLHRRKVALEYAKSVPKPKVVPRREPAPPAPSPPRATQRTTTTQGLSAEQQHELDVMDLQRLQQRHEQERQQVAIIRQNLDQAVSPRA